PRIRASRIPTPIVLSLNPPVRPEPFDRLRTVLSKPVLSRSKGMNGQCHRPGVPRRRLAKQIRKYPGRRQSEHGSCEYVRSVAWSLSPSKTSASLVPTIAYMGNMQQTADAAMPVRTPRLRVSEIFHSIQGEADAV